MNRGAATCSAALRGSTHVVWRLFSLRRTAAFVSWRPHSPAPLTFVVGPAFELVEPPDYEFLDHVVSAAFGPMLEAGAQLDPLPVANVLVQETSVFGN